MDYQKIYNQIIERAKNRTLDGYKEKHHIIPKCMGGDNGLKNLIELTAREHFICHKILVRIYPNNKKLKWALYQMSRFKKYSSNRDYENARKEISLLKQKSILQYDLNGNFIKEWNSGKEAAKINNFNPVNICSCLNGKGKSAHGFIWILKGKNIKNKINIKNFTRKTHKKRSPNKNKKYGDTKKVIQFDKNYNEINRFNSMIEAYQKTNIRPDSISACCRKLQKSAGGYIWEYNLSTFPIYTK
jgi:hypothetical protein